MTYDLHTVSRRLAASIGDMHDKACRDWDTNKTFTEEEMVQINTTRSLLNRLDDACKIETYGDAIWQRNMLLSLDHLVEDLRSRWCVECWKVRNGCMHGAQDWLDINREELEDAKKRLVRASRGLEDAAKEVEACMSFVAELEKGMHNYV